MKNDLIRPTIIAVSFSLISTFGASGEEPKVEKRKYTAKVEQICKEWPALTARSTTIAVDSSTIDVDDAQFRWFEALKEIEFNPREPVKFVVLDKSETKADLVLESCYPSFTDLEKEAHKGGMMSSSLERVERDLIKSFNRKLERGAKEALSIAEKKNAKDGEILKTLAAHASGFTDPEKFSRVVLYSNLDSQIVNQHLSLMGDECSDVFKNFAFEAGLSEYLIFGLSSDLSNSAKALWRDYFEQRGIVVSNLAPNLRASASIEISNYVKKAGKFWIDGEPNTKLAAKVSFVMAASSNQVPVGTIGFYTQNGWIYAPFKAEFGCDGEDCRMNGNVTSTVPSCSQDPFFKAEIDKIEFYGDLEGQLNGSLVTAEKHGSNGAEQNLSSGYSFAVQ